MELSSGLCISTANTVDKAANGSVVVPSHYNVSETPETPLGLRPSFATFGTPPSSLVMSCHDEIGIAKQILQHQNEPSVQNSHYNSSASYACRNGQPVLYSAIGSLEDPGSSSYKWNRNNKLANFDARSRENGSSYRSSLYSLEKNSDNLVDAKKPATSNQQNIVYSEIYHSSQPISLSEYDSAQHAKEQAIVLLDENPRTQSNLKTTSLHSSITDGETKVKSKSNKKVTIGGDQKNRKSKKKQQVVEMFQPSSDAYTPRMGKKEIKYKPAELRTPVQQMATPLGTISRPNFRDALKRVSMILRQHIVKIERRFEQNYDKQRQVSMGIVNQALGESYGSHHPSKQRREVDGLFHLAMKDEFSEDRFIIPKYKCTMIRIPMARMGMVCGLKHIRVKYEIPSEDEIYDFAHRLFKKVQLSSECSIVCLIYVERLMEISKVPLLANTWRPIFMCGLLLASKVWQDLSSWNIEFAGVYPQYSLDAINRLELQFLRSIKWGKLTKRM